MDIHAFPTGAQTPVDRAEATRIADDHLPADAPGTERRIAEFPEGFAVFAVVPTHAPADRPVPVGGSVYVIDKRTGAVSAWPTYPPSLIAEQYAAARVIVEDTWPDPD
ncbi:hypothetical protein ACFC06_10310 [Nocardia sp. NPDC056064]|uniref:hypothetical protein n=1 Tax=Nocardia sp. NPDC056064 TaxID=3345701 RepID=UPI0035D928A7